MKLALAILMLSLTAAAADDATKERNEKRLAKSRQKWDKLFPKIDLNGDEKLDRDEVTAYMQSGHHLHTKTNKAETMQEIRDIVKKEFGELDKDDDGLLDKEEMEGSSTGVKRNLRRRGESGDTDKKIDLDNYILLRNPHFASDEKTYIHFLAQDLQERWDTNNDKSFSYKEWNNMKAEERDNVNKFTKEENDSGMVTISFGGPSDDETTQRKAKDDADFKKFDENNDEQLDLKEFQNYLSTSAEGKWAAEVDEFFIFADHDKNGFLEKSEVHRNADFFAVSKIMKHRESLHAEL